MRCSLGVLGASLLLLLTGCSEAEDGEDMDDEYQPVDVQAILWCVLSDKCEEDLQALGAVMTNCEALVPERSVDYESPCDPDEWPPPPA